MNLIIESNNLEDYLCEIPDIIQFSTPLVNAEIERIKLQTTNRFEQAELAFKIARDEVRHSFDFDSEIVTISGEDTLKTKEGICFAKAHLFASLARGLEIPTGFCYQKVMKKGTPESGFALHGLNAVFLEDFGWFRVDPRGNKKGINSLFSPQKEKLAYFINTELGEIDYPNVLTHPLDSVILSMKNSIDTKSLFDNRPTAL